MTAAVVVVGAAGAIYLASLPGVGDAEARSLYLNSVYYGHGYWGDVAAARGYFGVSPRRLGWGQASLLAGLPQAPSAYDPERHPGLARHRQLHVLDQLVDDRYLSQSQADVALAEPLSLRASRPGAQPPP